MAECHAYWDPTSGYDYRTCTCAECRAQQDHDRDVRVAGLEDAVLRLRGLVGRTAKTSVAELDPALDARVRALLEADRACAAGGRR